jgi:hypothetical protein
MKKVIITLAILALASPVFGASMTITVPDEVAPQVINAFATLYNYQATIDTDENGDDIPNPESKAAFTRRMIREYVKNVYKAYKVAELEAQRQQVVSDAENDVSGVDVQTIP